MRSPFEKANTLKLAWLGALFALLTLIPILTQAEEKDLPDQNALLPMLQKAAGKKWVVEKTPEGYLLTYASPVLFYRATSESSKSGLNQRMTNGRMDSLRLKILFGATKNPREVIHSVNDVESDDDVPPGVSSQNKLTPAHYYITDPPVWAIGHRYSVYFVVNVAPEESLSPEEAGNDVYDALETFGEVFGGYPLRVIED